MKITAAHDHNDYEVGKRQNLPFLTIIDDNGLMSDICGEFAVSFSLTIVRQRCIIIIIIIFIVFIIFIIILLVMIVLIFYNAVVLYKKYI